jgi:hypothetical protein
MMPSEMGSMISTLLGLKEGNPVIAMLKVRSARAFLKAYLKRIGARAAYQRASRTVIRECLRC